MKRILGVILGILICTGAFYCLAMPALTFSSISVCFAITMFESAIAYFMLWTEVKRQGGKNGLLIVNAIISLLAAIILCTDLMTQLIVDTMLLTLIAIYMILNGILTIVTSFEIKKAVNNGSWIAVLIMGIMIVIAGGFSFANPLILAITIGIDMGLNILMVGISLIFTSIAYKE